MRCKAFVPGRSAENERSAGACRGVFDLDDAFWRDGGAAAAARGARAGIRLPPRRFAVEAAARGSDAYLGALPTGAHRPRKHKSFVDWQHDVTTKDLALATREGFHSIEHVKRYTTTGMATDQGKTSNLNAMAIVAQQLDVPMPEVGLTTFPHAVHARHVRQLRRHLARRSVRSGAHHAHARLGGGARRGVRECRRCGSARAIFRARGEDMHAAVARECLAVRNACGIFDASTLGKIEVVGADAAEFMNRLYVNNWTSLGVGRSRYGILCREDGFIYDDGVVARTARGPLPRDHHHRRRAARARHDGGLPANRMAGSEGLAHLDHRTVGGDRGAGAAVRARCSHPWSRASTSAPPPCRT